MSVLARLLLAPFLLSLADLAVTLTFQPEAYWQGDRSVVVEGNPIARYAMMIHPLLLLPGFLAWYALVIPLMLKTPAWFGLRVHLFLVSGHLIMVSGWLIRNAEDGWLWAALVILVTLPSAAFLFAPFRSQWEGKKPLRL